MPQRPGEQVRVELHRRASSAAPRDGTIPASAEMTAGRRGKSADQAAERVERVEPVDDPIVILVVAAAGAVIVFSVLWRWHERRQDSAYSAQRRSELAGRRAQQQAQQREIAQLAGRIVATSSTGDIPGYQIQRQIEAVFTDDHPTPARAVEALKAIASAKGANALINLRTGRALNAKCQASADAVLVRDMQAAPQAASLTAEAADRGDHENPRRPDREITPGEGPTRPGS